MSKPATPKQRALLFAMLRDGRLSHDRDGLIEVTRVTVVEASALIDIGKSREAPIGFEVPAMAEPNTISVRIAVVVCSKGHWAATGDANAQTEKDVGYVWDALECECSGPNRERLVWVTACVPLPTPSAEVKGESE